jgi:hypothetical protein
LLCHIVDLPKVKFDGLGPVANRFYETLQRVEPTGRNQSTATKSLIARNRSHTRKRAPCGRHISLALSCRVTSASASHSVTVSGSCASPKLQAHFEMKAV